MKRFLVSLVALCLIGQVAYAALPLTGIELANVTTTSSGLVGKASAASRYGYTMIQGTTAGYLCFLNAGTVPATSSAIHPVECVNAAANSTITMRQAYPDYYSTGLVAIDTTSTTTYTADTPVILELVVR